MEMMLMNIGQFGLAGAVIAYVFWRDHQREQRVSTREQQREQRMAEALETHQTWIAETLVAALKESTEAMMLLAHKPCLKEAE